MEPRDFLDGRVRLYAGDCLDAVRLLPDASVDAVVSDPPYGIAFMGRKWDTAGPEQRAFASEFWREVYRVLKPGGHILAFAATRTSHRLTCAIEDAGFEIRDMVAWLYGSGFPKSHDVSKGIDRAAGVEREVTTEGASGQGVPAGNALGAGLNVNFARRPISAAATDAARLWEGWGTALKPSNEPLTLARKPLTDNQEWATIFASLDQLEAKLWSMSSASTAADPSTPSPSVFDAGRFVSAQWSAAERASTQDALSDRMGTSQFASALTSSLNTACSWRRILADLSAQESTSITGTASGTTTDLRTLKFSVSKITPESIILAHSGGQWSSALACPAARYLNACAASFDATRERSALASAIEQWQQSCQGEGAPQFSPALEPITFARKPLQGTVAENVLTHGTGAVNIAGCRIEGVKEAAPVGQFRGSDVGAVGLRGMRDGSQDALGRWPANLIHDGSDEVLSAFPDAPGQQFTVGPQHGARDSVNCYGDYGARPLTAPRGDAGSAARFFYNAKADGDDRVGSKHPTVKPVT